jgi:hypothetical protein
LPSAAEDRAVREDRVLPVAQGEQAEPEDSPAWGWEESVAETARLERVGRARMVRDSAPFPHIVDDNRQYLAERRALRAAKVEQARQRLAARQERPTKHREVAANFSKR